MKTAELTDIYQVPAVAAARAALMDLEAQDTRLRQESDSIWRLINPHQTTDEFVLSTPSERAIARSRQDEVRREREVLRVKLEAAERAVVETSEAARADNERVYEVTDAALCSRLDAVLEKALDIVDERLALIDRASVMNRGRAVDGGPLILTADTVSSWRNWRRQARRP